MVVSANCYAYVTAASIVFCGWDDIDSTSDHTYSVSCTFFSFTLFQLLGMVCVKYTAMSKKDDLNLPLA